MSKNLKESLGEVRVTYGRSRRSWRTTRSKQTSRTLSGARHRSSQWTMSPSCHWQIYKESTLTARQLTLSPGNPLGPISPSSPWGRKELWLRPTNKVAKGQTPNPLPPPIWQHPATSAWGSGRLDHSWCQWCATIQGFQGKRKKNSPSVHPLQGNREVPWALARPVTITRVKNKCECNVRRSEINQNVISLYT